LLQIVAAKQENSTDT